ncbi:hypothetical protein [Thermoanaerobacterium sp. DL9XJH110]|uniref:hypothetical protein n=1 Tax=Thermoanaerobacterium sp. DL9XJH110 TaxID=3386643 RepID=UPI003BB4D1AB
MATLIQQWSGGHRRRCDARCYNGHGNRCTCICGGANHGKGLQQAMQNTVEMAKELLKKADTEVAKDILKQLETVER